MNKMTIKDMDLAGKKVIMRVDFNVPLDEQQKITDDIRIQAALPSILYALEQNPSKLILMSHLGRPEGQVVDAMSLAPVAVRLAELIGEKVLKCSDCVGDVVAQEIANAE